MRIQEILSNPTGSPITVKVAVRSDLGAPLGVGAAWTSSEDSEVTPADYWAVTTHSAPPEGVPRSRTSSTATGVRTGWTPSAWSGHPLLGWREVTVPAGETRILMYYVARICTFKCDGEARRSAGRTPGSVDNRMGADGYTVLNWPTELLVGVEEAEAVPELYSLAQNYPTRSTRRRRSAS